MSVLDVFLKNHFMLCDGAPDGSFIEKDKYQYIVNKIPKVPLRKLSEGDFKNGIMELTEFDTGKIEKQSHGKFLYVEENSVKVPAVYELLCEILHHTEADARLKLFHDITNDYYNKVMSKHGLTKDQFRKQVKLFLPYAKLERLYQLCRQESVPDIERAALDVEECILYPELSREECSVILRNIYQSNEAVPISFDVIPTQDLPGYLGKYLRIELVARNGTKTQTHRLFAKIVDWDDLEKTEFSLLPFRKERFFFESLLESCKQLGLEKLTDFCPKCYFANDSMLLFEDISVDGYSSWNFHIPVSYNWLVATTKLLAKLHATSIILEERLSEKLGRTVRLDEEYPDGLYEAANQGGEKFEPIISSGRRCICDLLSKFSDVPKKIHMDCLKNKVSDASFRVCEVIQKSDKIRNVVNHGDMWGANIMYKEDKVTGIPSAYLIDFQIVRYCPPSVDLMLLLYANTDRSTRLKYLKELVELYYKELTYQCSCYDVDVENIFTFDQLMESCREVEPAIICTALMYGQLLLMPEQFRKDLMSDKERAKQYLFGDRVRELEKVWYFEPLRTRVQGLIEDIIQIYEDEM